MIIKPGIVGPGGGWSFDQISDLIALYDTNLLTGLSDTDPIGTFTDGSGNSNDLTQATASKKPTYHVDVKNGYPAARSDGVDDYMQVAFSSLTQPTTIFVAGRFIDINAGNTGMLFSGDDIGHRNTIYKYSTNDNLYFYAGTAVASSTNADTDWHYWVAIFNGASSSLRQDGVEIASGNIGAQVLDGFTLGARYDGGSNTNFDYLVTGIYQKAVSGAELTTLETNLAIRTA